MIFLFSSLLFFNRYLASQSPHFDFRSIVGYTLLIFLKFCLPFAFKVLPSKEYEKVVGNHLPTTLNCYVYLFYLFIFTLHYFIIMSLDEPHHPTPFLHPHNMLLLANTFQQPNNLYCSLN